MQKFFFFICVFVSFLLSIQSYAAVITVDANHPSAGMYKNLQDAHDAANSGDTILVYPFGGTYDAITVTKKLRIVGRGWNHLLTKNIATTISGTIYFKEGSDGSALEGFRKDFKVYIYVDDITIKRNKLHRIYIGGGLSGTVIIQNYFVSTNIDTLISVSAFNEVFIANNILIMTWYYTSGSSTSKAIYANSDKITINIAHNYIFAKQHSLLLDESNYYVTNNIFNGGSISPKSNLGFHNNICNSDQLYTPHGNMINVDMNTVYSGSMYQLKENSPSIGAGTNGSDIGIYGGSTPFVLGGYPSIPRIVNIEADHLGTKSHGLDVKIKATTVRE
ncbi:cell surface glycoprotein [Candidatus Magnetomorum sp. HK-1]|nr:cell surface glycoprotein [Candidatus Magnetomorum sp. HK-1]